MMGGNKEVVWSVGAKIDCTAATGPAALGIAGVSVGVASSLRASGVSFMSGGEHASFAPVVVPSGVI